MPLILSVKAHWGFCKKVNRARKYFLDAQRYEPQARDRFVSLYLGSNAALCALRCGDKQDARRRADATLQALLSTPSFGNSVADAVAPLVETYFLLWSERQHNQEGILHSTCGFDSPLLHSVAWRQSFPSVKPSASLAWTVCRASRVLSDWRLAPRASTRSRPALSDAVRFRVGIPCTVRTSAQPWTAGDGTGGVAASARAS